MMPFEETAKWMKEEIERNKMMSPEEFMKWFMEKSRESEADHQKHLKEMEEMDREREERDRKREADHQKHLKEMDRKREADHQEHLKRIDELKNGPPIPHPIIPCPIPSPPIQEVSSLQV